MYYTNYINYVTSSCRTWNCRSRLRLAGKARAAIAATVDALGDRFKPELRTGWLAYTREFYSNGPVAPAATMGEETLVLDDCVLDARG